MAKFRRLIVPTAVAWLVVHALVVTGTTTIVVLAADGSSSDIVCTCAHGTDHRSCPMHKTPRGSTGCRMQSTQDDLGLALASMLGSLTLPVDAVTAIVEAAAPSLIVYRSPLLTDRTVPPDLPPPRS